MINQRWEVVRVDVNAVEVGVHAAAGLGVEHATAFHLLGPVKHETVRSGRLRHCVIELPRDDGQVVSSAEVVPVHVGALKPLGRASFVRDVEHLLQLVKRRLWPELVEDQKA